MPFVQDFGGDGPVVHLAHANGFPPGAYQPLAEALAGRYHVIGLPARLLWPGSRPEEMADWHTLADDLAQGLKALGLRAIAGVGHSMGGVATLWAAVRCPELFRAVVLIDPVILPPRQLFLMRVLPRLGMKMPSDLAQGALRRRRTWPNREACYDDLRLRPFFATWPERSLRAYMEAGTRERPEGGVELTYPPEWEAHIFATTPTDVWRDIPCLSLPALVTGEKVPGRSSRRRSDAWSDCSPRPASSSFRRPVIWPRWSGRRGSARRSGSSSELTTVPPLATALSETKAGYGWDLRRRRRLYGLCSRWGGFTRLGASIAVNVWTVYMASVLMGVWYNSSGAFRGPGKTVGWSRISDHRSGRRKETVCFFGRPYGPAGSEIPLYNFP